MPFEPAPLFVIRPPGRPPYEVTLEQLTALVRAARVLRMGRLADKLAKATDAIAGVELATERDVDKIIERTKELHAKREDVMLRKTLQLDAQMSDLAEFGKDLDAFDGKNEPSNVGERSEKLAALDGTPYGTKLA